MNKETVCAVVVTYNRKDLLLECLEGLRKQTRPVDAIYLVDNASTDGTPELLLEKVYIKELPPLNIVEPWEKEFEVENFVDHQSIKIHYVRMHENTGGAGGFYEGMKRAYEKGYDWFWLMDDDVELKEDTLAKLWEEAIKFPNYTFTSLKLSLDGKVQISHHRNTLLPNNYYINIFTLPKTQAVLYSSFVSWLLPRRIVEKVGFPNRNFFIYYDDTEYSIRISKISKVILVKESQVFHKEHKAHLLNKYKKFLWKVSSVPRIPIQSYWIMYYSIRNLFYLGIRYEFKKIIFLVRFFSLLLATIIGIILYDDHKCLRIFLLLKAVNDGFWGLLGRRLIPDRWKWKFSIQ